VQKWENEQSQWDQANPLVKKRTEEAHQKEKMSQGPGQTRKDGLSHKGRGTLSVRGEQVENLSGKEQKPGGKNGAERW